MVVVRADGVTRNEYRNMAKDLMQLDWSCALCNRPDPEEPADDSFNISTAFQVTEATHEESLPLETSTLDDVEPEDLPTSYQEVSQGSKRGNRKLVDSRDIYTERLVTSLFPRTHSGSLYS
ncbi:uncharacterized protein LOC117316764 [Pecten maximus]|uniref:uncharacterized protein LOC117316764 n=1 Tax=Pecten maximus TaxID=6579 RepID=UPI0014582E07|nr:uncharacterized protein LOC117316764 [Pecten maximus]